MITMPDILDKKIIKRLKKGKFHYNGAKLTMTYKQIKDRLGDALNDKPSSDYPGNKMFTAKDYPEEITFGFAGKPKWKKNQLKLITIDYNHLDRFYDLKAKDIRKVWGNPDKKKKNSFDWDDEGIFDTYTYRYGHTWLWFDKEKNLFAMTYLNRKLQKKWGEI